jgi:hypothetical protein
MTSDESCPRPTQLSGVALLVKMFERDGRCARRSGYKFSQEGSTADCAKIEGDGELKEFWLNKHVES